MKNALYYFSGTGNSLVVARKIAESLGNCEIKSIAMLRNKTEIKGDVIGIITPIYMYNMPHIVADFISKIKTADYIFVVYSGGGELGSGIKATKKIFKEASVQLSAVFNIPMPSNYTPFGCPSEDRRNEILGRVDQKVDDIVSIIRKKAEHYDSGNTSFARSYLYPGPLYKMGYKYISSMDRSFRWDDNCNSCGICAKVCPVENIDMQEGRPVWQGQCQQCFACLQWCPQQAIQYGKKTVGIERYHHPGVALKDMLGESV